VTEAVEFTITKYPRGKHPHHDGTVIWGRVVSREEFTKREKAFYRLKRIIEASDPDSIQYLFGDTLEVTRMRKDAAFNDMGEVIYAEDLSGTEEAYRLQRKHCIGYLVKYLSDINDAYNYYYKIEPRVAGGNGYLTGTRYTKVFNSDDKKRLIKQKINGRKSAISKSINKIRKIMDSYANTLMPEGYRSDRKFVSLLAHLPAQRKRLYEAETMHIDEVEDISGRIEEVSRPSLEILLSQQA
jgi:hypothetical protein